MRLTSARGDGQTESDRQVVRGDGQTKSNSQVLSPDLTINQKSNSTWFHCHTPSREMAMGSPAHENLSQMNKRNLGEPFGEQVPKLVPSINLDNDNSVGFIMDMLPKPVILDGIVL